MSARRAWGAVRCGAHERDDARGIYHGGGGAQSVSVGRPREPKGRLKTRLRASGSLAEEHTAPQCVTEIIKFLASKSVVVSTLCNLSLSGVLWFLFPGRYSATLLLRLFKPNQWSAEQNSPSVRTSAARDNKPRAREGRRGWHCFCPI